MIVLVSIHGLLLLAAYRLMLRDDLDEDPLLESEHGGENGSQDGSAP